MVCFAGAAFESPTSNKYTLAKSSLLDFFRGPELKSVDVEGLQYMICVSAMGDEEDESLGRLAPAINIRCYMISTKRSGSRMPKVEVEEMGPRVDLRLGRVKEAEEGKMKEAMKRPKTTEPRPKKNIETDLLGDKVGRIHVGKQNLDKLQTRKMKGLKRRRGVDDLFDDAEAGEDEIVENGDAKRVKTQ